MSIKDFKDKIKKVFESPKRFWHKAVSLALKVGAWFMFIVFLASMSALDSISWVPAIACGVSLVCMVLLAYASVAVDEV